jgi:hypothetical protein
MQRFTKIHTKILKSIKIQNIHVSNISFYYENEAQQKWCLYICWTILPAISKFHRLKNFRSNKSFGFVKKKNRYSWRIRTFYWKNYGKKIHPSAELKKNTKTLKYLLGSISVKFGVLWGNIRIFDDAMIFAKKIRLSICHLRYFHVFFLLLVFFI